MNRPVYMDHAATTPLDERVLDVMMPYLRQAFGNAASRTHAFGHEAEAAVTRARKQVAALVGAEPKEMVWTSGATEANNLAIFGVVLRQIDRGCHVVTQATEHSAVRDACRELERRGVEVTWLGVDADGRISLDELRAALKPHTALVTIMAANNEVGALQPIRDIGRICHEAGVLFHTDATQAVGKVPVDVQADGIDLLSLSAHKIYGPKGVGALYVRSRSPRVKLHPLLFGGGHERGMRSGTINVPGVVGLGKACEIAGEEMAAEAERLSALRNHLEATILEKLDYVRVNARSEHRLPHITNMSFEYIEGESLLMGLDDVALSNGSACSTMSMEPSHVLCALGIDEDLAFSSVRFSLGKANTAAHVEYVVDRVVGEVKKLRELNPIYTSPDRLRAR